MSDQERSKLKELREPLETSELDIDVNLCHLRQPFDIYCTNDNSNL